MLAGLLVPMFILGLKFWTAPIYSAYASKLNACVAPLAMGPIFFSHHIDITLMGIVVLLMNSYVFWYHVDPPAEYNQSQHRRYQKFRGDVARRHQQDSSDDDNVTYGRKIDYGKARDVGLKVMSAGMPIPHMFAQ